MDHECPDLRRDALVLSAAVLACFVALGLVAALAALMLAYALPALPHGLLLGMVSLCGAAVVRGVWRMAAPVWWPTTQGRVVGAGGIQTGSAPDAPDLQPVVEYAYEVHGVEYRNWFARPDATEAGAARHPPGAALPVRYDPRRPEHAATGLLLDGDGLVPSAVVLAMFAALAVFADAFGAWLLVPFTALFLYGPIRSLWEPAADVAARRAATPVRREQPVEPAVASTAEVPAPPAVRAVIAREGAATTLQALGFTAFGAVLAGVPLSFMGPELGRALLGSTRLDLFGFVFSGFVTLVMVGSSGLIVWGVWRAAADASRDVREAVYLETTGPVHLNRKVDGEGDSSWWLTVGDQRFAVDLTLYERLVSQLQNGRVAVVAHTKRTDRLLGVRLADGDSGAALTDFPMSLAPVRVV